MAVASLSVLVEMDRAVIVEFAEVTKFPNAIPVELRAVNDDKAELHNLLNETPVETSALYVVEVDADRIVKDELTTVVKRDNATPVEVKAV